ncbi:MAG: hypothetical protein KDJ35_05355 [Alphaproteobacteria bacterium]|nr:hypothetical protein [Alphaproteobacteria bacterium]
MRGVHFYIVLVLIPAVLALGHDIALLLENSSFNELIATMQSGERPLMSYLSDLGFIWTHYARESYESVRESSDPQTWEMIKMLLMQKALFVALAFAGVNFLLLFILKLLKVGPFKG